MLHHSTVSSLTLLQTLKPPPNARRQTKNPASARRWTCTHIVVDRKYGEHICYQCGKIPDMKWVYVCMQDSRFSPSHMPSASLESLSAVSDDDDYFATQAKLAESLAMSASVVQQMRDGKYSYDQMETLLTQRRRVIETLRKVECPSATSVASSQSSLPHRSEARSSTGSDLNGALAMLPCQQRRSGSHGPGSSGSSHVGASAMHRRLRATRQSASATTGCHYQACYTCRPYFEERVALNLEAVLDDPTALEPQNQEMSPGLLVKASIARNLGLREPRESKPVSEAGSVTVPHAQGVGAATYTDEPSITATDSDSTLSSEGSCPRFVRQKHDSSGGADEWRRLLHLVTHSDGQRGPCIMSPIDHSLYHRSSVPSTPERASSNRSSVSLPDTPTGPVTPTTPPALTWPSPATGLRQKAASVSGVALEDSKLTHGFGGEVEVEGGVALREETVKMRVPDIITD